MSKVVFSLFIFTLIFSPLAFGTVEPWSLTVMETASFLAFFLFLYRSSPNREDSLYEIPGITPLLCLLILVGIQLVPLPGSFVRLISPETYDIYKETIFIDHRVSWISLSLNKKATLTEFCRLSSYVVFYALAIQVLSRKESLKKTVAIVTIFASMLSLFAILQHILWNNKIYWVRGLTLGGNPFGPYVNRNHYAGLMEMVFPVALSLFFFYKPHTTYKTLRRKIAEIFNVHRTNIHVLLGFSCVLIATSIFLTLSRSGIVSLCISMIIFGLLFMAKGTDKKRGIIITAVFVLVALAVGWFGWAPVIERFERLKNTQGNVSELRIDLWKDSANIVKDFPLTGTGFGTFSDIYPKYRTLEGNAIAGQAHNDYLELLSDGGITAFFLCIWFLGILFYKSYRIFRKRRELYSIYLYIASIAGITSILSHSLTDFNLRIGANGLYFFFLAGLAVSAANTRLRDGLNDTYLKKRKVPMKSLTGAVGFFLIACCIFQGGVTIGKIYFSSIEDKRLDGRTSRPELVSIRETASKASFFDPLEAKYRYAIGNVERLLGGDALKVYRESLFLDPVKGEYLERLGLMMSELGKYDEADLMLRTGIIYDARDPDRYRRYALWLFSRGRVREGMKIAREAISLEPEKTLMSLYIWFWISLL